MALNATYDRPAGEAAPSDEAAASTHERHHEKPPPPPKPVADGARERGGQGGRSLGASLSEVASSAKSIVERQIDIWMTKFKIHVVHVGVVVGFMAAALGLIVVGMIFLLIGLFRILTDVFHIAPVWASLIFAGVCVILAILCCLPVLFSGNKRKHKK